MCCNGSRVLDLLRLTLLLRFYVMDWATLGFLWTTQTILASDICVRLGYFRLALI